MNQMKQKIEEQKTVTNEEEFNNLIKNLKDEY